MESLLSGFLRTAGMAVTAAVASHAFAAEPSVPYVPTPQVVVDRMLQMAKITPQDYVIDLGSGDGRIVITAVKKYGARGFGVDLNPVRIKESTENAAKAGVSDRVSFYQRNLFETDFTQATVITMYLLPNLNLKLRPKILNLKPGTRIVSHAFTMDDWSADQTESFDGRTAYMWIVPAKAEGTWQLAQGQLTLAQNFQMVLGTFASGGNTVMITNGRLRGDQLTFSAGGSEYTGRVNGNSVEGTVKGASSGTWSATRVNSKPAAAPAK